MGDLIAIAFQQDRTRVATFLIDPERWDTPRMYHGQFDSPQNHHVRSKPVLTVSWHRASIMKCD